MGPDIGEVRTNYLRQPGSAAYHFAWHLAREWDDECWQVSSGANVFIELGCDQMVERAARYISLEEPGASDAHQVMRRVGGLPWWGWW